MNTKVKTEIKKSNTKKTKLPSDKLGQAGGVGMVVAIASGTGAGGQMNPSSPPPIKQ